MPELESEGQASLGENLNLLREFVLRRRWWIIVPACVAILATLAVLRVLPNRYTSEATLLVVQQQVPERYVVPNSTTDISAELQALQQEILSRPRLNDIIQEFGLYAKEMKRLAPEQVIGLMVRDIGIKPFQANTPQNDLAGFKITFTAQDPVVAQQVTSKLTQLFIQENLKAKEESNSNTTAFLHAQLESTKAKLAEQEQRVRDYKMQHLGELPEQQAGNLAIMGSLQTQLQNTLATLNRAHEQKVYLQSMLSGYNILSTRPTPTTVTSTPDVPKPNATPLEAAENDLLRLRAAKAKLLSMYTPRFPEVIQVDAQIVAAEKLRDRLKATAPKVEPKVSQPVQPDVPATIDNPAVAQVTSQLQANRVEIENLSKEEKRLKAELAQYQNRLNSTPIREQQLTGMLREMELQRLNYADLLSKEQQSQLATNLGRDQRGQQFRLVDPPSLPVVPVSPKRLQINAGGVAGGLVLGLVLAFLVEMKSRSFHNEKQLAQRFPQPFVVSVPVLLTQSEGRARTVKRSLEWLAGGALAFVVCAAELYFYRNR